MILGTGMGKPIIYCDDVTVGRMSPFASDFDLKSRLPVWIHSHLGVGNSMSCLGDLNPHFRNVDDVGGVQAIVEM